MTPTFTQLTIETATESHCEGRPIAYEAVTAAEYEYWERFWK